jgi:hypothetical protein
MRNVYQKLSKLEFKFTFTNVNLNFVCAIPICIPSIQTVLPATLKISVRKLTHSKAPGFLAIPFQVYHCLRKSFYKIVP